MNKKKILVLLATLVISTALAACGNNDSGYTTGDNSKDGRSQVSQGELQSIPDFSAKDIEGNKVDNSIFKENKVTLVNVWATWCGPCKMIGPVISELANDYDGKIVVGKCNIEDNDDIAIDYGVRNIPTILFFKNGELVDKFVGAASKDKLDEKFKTLL